MGGKIGEKSSQNLAMLNLTLLLVTKCFVRVVWKRGSLFTTTPTS